MPLGILDTVGGDLPLPLGGGQAVGVPQSDVDVLVDRTPFWLAISADTPYQRATAQWQKDQTDQQPEAGEQSLAGWWTRSQMSFHFGAGLDYLDTVARPQPEDRLRYKTSRNVNVWTPGVVTRLNGTTLARTLISARMWVEPIADGVIVASGDKLEVLNGSTWSSYSLTDARAFATDGVNYYVAGTSGIYKGSLASPSTTALPLLYNLPGTDVPMQLSWVKQRLMLGHGANVYELDVNAATPTLPTPKMTHPTASWTWTSFADSPTGILASGYAGQSSAVFRFEITEVSSAPVLGTGIALLSMPLGERITSMCMYLGAMLVLGTSRGIRVSTFQSYYGTITLGPLSALTTAPVTALAGSDRYIYGGTLVNGETSLVRVDLGAPLDDQGHYAWAPDLVFPDAGTWTNAPLAITFQPDGRKVIAVASRGLVLEDATTDPSEAAWLQTARIRMGTVEDKYFTFATLRGNYGVTAPIGVSVCSPADPTAWDSVYVATVSSERFGLRSSPQEWVALRFDFAEGAELGSYQVQALPAGKRQRLLSIPVRLSDHETTRSGVGVGYRGWAVERLQAVEHLDELGAEITVSAPALFDEAVRCVIERVEFTQPADVGDSTVGSHGTLTIVLRTTV